MTKKLNIYWIQELEFYGEACEVEHTGFAEYVKDDGDDDNPFEDYINFVDERGFTFDHVEQSDCNLGITLDMIWEDLESAVDENGRLDVTDIEIGGYF